MARSERKRRINLKANAGDPIKGSIPYLLTVAARLQTSNFMGSLAGTAVHPAESYILHELWKASPLSRTELAKRLGIGNASVGQTVARLEKGGFVQRIHMPGDNRRVMVRLTDKGLTAHMQFHAKAVLLIEDIEAVIGKNGVKTMTKHLQMLVDHFAENLGGE